MRARRASLIEILDQAQWRHSGRNAQRRRPSMGVAQMSSNQHNLAEPIASLGGSPATALGREGDAYPMTKKPQADAKTRSSSKGAKDDASSVETKSAKPKAAKPKARKAEAPETEAAPPDVEIVEVYEIDASEPDELIIRERAYAIWVEEGQPHGRDAEHWHRAREEVASKSKSKSKSKPRAKSKA
jgi:hypothetical protein